MKKVFSAIGKFFRAIWRYIKNNAWIQPILMVGLIFAIIFGLTAAPDAWNTIKGWVTTDDEEPKYVTELGGSRAKKGKNGKGATKLIDMFEDEETFVVIFGGTDCTNCKSLNKNVLNVFLESKAGKSYRDDIYYFYSNQYIEYIDSEYEDEDYESVESLIKKYEDNIMEKHYIPAFETTYDVEYITTSSIGTEYEFYSAQTPTILYVVEGEVMGFLYGDISDKSNAVLRFEETLSAWDTAKKDLEKGKAEFEAVLETLNLDVQG